MIAFSLTMQEVLFARMRVFKRRSVEKVKINNVGLGRRIVPVVSLVMAVSAIVLLEEAAVRESPAKEHINVPRGLYVTIKRV